MPSVPRYSQPKIQEQALRGGTINVNTSIEAFGGGAANAAPAAGKLAGVVGEIAAQEKKRVDELKDYEIQDKLTQWKRERLFDPEKGALLAQGQDALKVSELVKQDYEKFTSELGKGLTGTQADMFNRRKTEHLSNIMEKLEVHAFGEMEKYEDQRVQSRLENARIEAIDNFGDPKAIQHSLNEQAQVLLKYADRKGMGADWAQQKIQAQVSKTHFDVIERMLANDLDGNARQHYSRNKDFFVGDDKIRAEKLLKSGTVKGESMRLADRILSETNEIGAAMEYAKKIGNPDIRDAVENRIKDGFALKAKQDREKDDAQFMEAFRYTAEGGSMDNVPEGLLQALGPEQKTALQSVVASRKLGVERKTDPQVFNKYASMLIGPMGKLTEAELIQKVYPHVSDQDFKQISNQWQLARKGLGGDKAKEAEFKSLFSDKDMILGALKQTKIDGFNDSDTLDSIHKSSKKSAAYQAFTENVDNAFKSHFATTGKMPNDAEKKQIINGLMMKKVTVDGGWLKNNTSKPIAMLSPEGAKKVVVPDQVKPNLISLAKKMGIIPPNMTTADAEQKLKKTMPQAYHAILQGKSEREAAEILRNN